MRGDVKGKGLGVKGRQSSHQHKDSQVPRFTPPPYCSRLRGSLTCSKMPCYGAVFF